MTKTTAEEPAYPSEYDVGLTKREHYAARALQGLLANSKNEYEQYATLTADAVRFADELINSLEPTQEKVHD